MKAELTYEEIASDFKLWGEYVDPDGVDSEEEFNRMTLEQRVEIIDTLFWYEAQDNK